MPIGTPMLSSFCAAQHSWKEYAAQSGAVARLTVDPSLQDYDGT